MQIQSQIHGRFKVFVGALAADGTLGALSEEVATWVRHSGAAPKSIGVEYIEGLRQLVLTVGYRDDEPGYPVALRSVRIGRVDNLDEPGRADLERRMTEAAAGFMDVICHELYITEEREVVMTFLLHQAATQG
jgi:hypothetical protein